MGCTGSQIDCFGARSRRLVPLALALVAGALPLMAVLQAQQVQVRTTTNGILSPPSIGHVVVQARGFEPTVADLHGPGPHNFSATGHIFIEIVVNTDKGPVSDTYGFYPDKNPTEGILKSAGSLQSETRCSDCTPSSIAKHYGAIQSSVEVDMNYFQQRDLIQLKNTWNLKHYQLFDSNCIDFVDSAMHALGYPTPERYGLQTPVAYMKALKTVVEVEKQKRAQALEEQKKKEAVKVQEEERLRDGWVMCQCPWAHGGSGVVIDGQLYHPASLRCPE